MGTTRGYGCCSTAQKGRLNDETPEDVQSSGDIFELSNSGFSHRPASSPGHPAMRHERETVVEIRILETRAAVDRKPLFDISTFARRQVVFLTLSSTSAHWRDWGDFADNLRPIPPSAEISLPSSANRSPLRGRLRQGCHHVEFRPATKSSDRGIQIVRLVSEGHGSSLEGAYPDPYADDGIEHVLERLHMQCRRINLRTRLQDASGARQPSLTACNDHSPCSKKPGSSAGGGFGRPVVRIFPT